MIGCLPRPTSIWRNLPTVYNKTPNNTKENNFKWSFLQFCSDDLLVNLSSAGVWNLIPNLGKHGAGSQICHYTPQNEEFAPENWPKPKKESGFPSKHHLFRGELLVFREYTSNMRKPASARKKKDCGSFCLPPAPFIPRTWHSLHALLQRNGDDRIMRQRLWNDSS